MVSAHLHKAPSLGGRYHRLFDCLPPRRSFVQLLLSIMCQSCGLCFQVAVHIRLADWHDLARRARTSCCLTPSHRGRVLVETWYGTSPPGAPLSCCGKLGKLRDQFCPELRTATRVCMVAHGSWLSFDRLVQRNCTRARHVAFATCALQHVVWKFRPLVRPWWCPCCELPPCIA